MNLERARFCCLVSAALLLPSNLAAQEQLSQEAPIPALLAELSPAVREYDAHVTFLSNPFLEGRLPGTRGMEIAKDYVEDYLVKIGLTGPFDGGSFRQPFGVGSRVEVQSAALSAGGVQLVHGQDFGATGMGKSGSFKGPVTFCGYGIERGNDGYRGFPDGTDLSGQVALIMRFEPMDEAGKSLWATRGPWTGRSGFSRKLRALKKLGAKAVVMVNTPGADDERIADLMIAGRGSRSHVDVPVMMVSAESAERLLQSAGAETGLMDLRRAADKEGVVRGLGFEMHVEAHLEENELLAENVIGILPGRGELAEEYVVLGAHLDHLGMGDFGSREGKGKLHPGADDNASGSAAVMMIAARLVEHYRELPEEQPARSILFMCFSAEESGLIGSSYYCKNPLFDIGAHKLMVNFDMIGRIIEGRLSVSGAQTGEGMQDWLAPHFERSPLTVIEPANLSGASDHTPFLRAKMPVLFGITPDFHDDYHTSRDTVDKINRVGAVHTIDLFEAILSDAGTRPELFALAQSRSQRDRQGPRNAGGRGPGAGGGGSAFLGVTMQLNRTGMSQLVIRSVLEDGPAAKAGLLAEDEFVKWNGKAIADVASWRNQLSKHEPGDKVQVTVLREGKEVILWVTLGGTPRGGG